MTVRTIQRVEAGQLSSLDTRRAIARGFQIPDIDVFNKPNPFPTHEELEQQKAEFDRKFLLLDARVIDGRKILANSRTPGSDYGPKGKPIEVDAHDFENKELGKVVPYGVYDIGANSGYVSLGIDHDTAQFAVNATRLWLNKMGRERYPDTRKVMVTADCGDSNGPRLRVWKVELQQLADERNLEMEQD